MESYSEFSSNRNGNHKKAEKIRSRVWGLNEWVKGIHRTSRAVVVGNLGVMNISPNLSSRQTLPIRFLRKNKHFFPFKSGGMLTSSNPYCYSIKKIFVRRLLKYEVIWNWKYLIFHIISLIKQSVIKNKSQVASEGSPKVMTTRRLLTFLGVPNTWQILKISSTSLVPGKSGLNVYSSAIILPTAHMSMGELYTEDLSKTSGARYLWKQKAVWGKGFPG